MPLDSRDKRAAAISFGIPFIVIAPLADGSIDAADRAMIAHAYPGIEAAPPTAEDATTAEVMHGMMRMIRFVKAKLIPYGNMYID